MKTGALAIHCLLLARSHFVPSPWRRVLTRRGGLKERLRARRSDTLLGMATRKPVLWSGRFTDIITQ
jgi:hypothetical protein